MKFLSYFTEYANDHLGDFFDSVREEAQQLLLSITQRFLPPEINMDPESLE